jgi:prephenate dehydratase
VPEPAQPPSADAPKRIGFLGPRGTYTEQALRSQADLAGAELVPYATILESLDAVDDGEVDAAFIPIENAIEGTVSASQDALAFTHDLFVQREVVLDIRLAFMTVPGADLAGIRRIVSMPMATAQCRQFIHRTFPEAIVSAHNSTAGAAKDLGESGERDTAVIGPTLSGELYGLHTVFPDVADHPGNQTRFLLVQPHGVPAPTGHDKTSVIVYQQADVPGSLISILQEFAARRINLVKLESRPTKSALGDYCFVIDAEGHIDDELLADALRALHAKQGGVKFLGSYPAAGEHGEARRADASARYRDADAWLADLRRQVRR